MFTPHPKGRLRFARLVPTVLILALLIVVTNMLLTTSGPPG
ncbi:hypothetical protein [Shimia sp. R10_1]|nr:hypothetical protein [Shimia sp. R10_1]